MVLFLFSFVRMLQDHCLKMIINVHRKVLKLFKTIYILYYYFYFLLLCYLLRSSYDIHIKLMDYRY
jgi:hypothetical protein